MAILIPSKNTFDKNSDIIRQNIILGSTSEQTKVTKINKSLFNFSWQILTEEDARTMFGLVGWYQFNWNDLPQIQNIGGYDVRSGSLYTARLDIKIDSDSYIDIATLKIDIKARYRYCRAYDSNFGRVIYSSIDEEKTTVAKGYDIPIVTEYQSQLIPSVSNSYVGSSMQFTRRISNPTTPSASKSVTVQLGIPFAFQYFVDDETRYNSCFVTNVEVDIYGDTYDLSSTITSSYGESASNIELSSNELLQTDTTYRGDSVFDYLSKQIVENYKNGKSTATIRTSIGEYYNDDGTLAISTYKPAVTDVDWASGFNEIINLADNSHGKIVYSIPENLPISWFDNVGGAYLEEGTYIIYVKFPTNNWYGRVRLNTYSTYSDGSPSIYDGNTGQQSFTISTKTRVYLHYCSDVSNTSANSPFEFEIKIVRVDENNKRMTFELHDKVIPMVYGSDGQDHPMSLYQDGSPKVFQVVGTKIFYDGAVWQELSLQEI